MAALVRRVTTESPFTLTLTIYQQDAEEVSDPDPTGTDPDTYVGAVTCEIIHVNGSQIFAQASATRQSAGVYTIVIPAQKNVAEGEVKWRYNMNSEPCVVRQYLSVIRNHYIEISDLRAMDGINVSSNPNALTVYPTSMLMEKRDEAEVLVEEVCGAYTTKYARDVLDGDPRLRNADASAVKDVVDYLPQKRLQLYNTYPQEILAIWFADIETQEMGPAPQPITTLAAQYNIGDPVMYVTSTLSLNPQAQWPINSPIYVDGIEGRLNYQGLQIDPFGLTGVTGGLQGVGLVGATVKVPYSTQFDLYPDGEIYGQLQTPAFIRGIQNVVIEYTYGQTVMPSDLILACKRYARYLVLQTNSRVSDRATSLTNEQGTFRIAQAVDWDKPTGLPEVDAVLRRRGIRLPAFA
jgi:hypothetical protein